MPRSSVIEMMHRVPAELIEAGTAQRAKKAGDFVPSFALRDSEGNVVSLAGLLWRGPLVLSFFHGVWCPYCYMELKALEAAKPQFDAHGASLFAISPQTAPSDRESMHRNKFSFPVLSDVKGKVGGAFRLRFSLPDNLIELYRQMEHDLPTLNDDPCWTLPIPSRYVIGQDGMILYSEVNLDYTRPPKPEDMIPVLPGVATARALDRGRGGG